jgi:hypothetical protein
MISARVRSNPRGLNLWQVIVLSVETLVIVAAFLLFIVSSVYLAVTWPRDKVWACAITSLVVMVPAGWIEILF